MIFVTVPGVRIDLAYCTPDPIGAIESAARTCYQSEGSTRDEFIRMLRKRGHTAMFEFADARLTFVVDRGVTHEAVRQRLCSFAQESTRYCDYSKEKFGGLRVIPMMDGLTEAQKQRRLKLYEMCEEVYLAERAEGVPAQQARDNLPTCTGAEIVIKANLREWRWIMDLRTAPDAHPQMRKVMLQAKQLLFEYAPAVFEDMMEGRS